MMNRIKYFPITIIAILVTIGLLSCGMTNQQSKTSSQMATKSAEPPATVVQTLPALLRNTQWRLIEFQSMDDAIGTQRPDDPTKYIMQLKSDGSVSFKLNCNAAKGTWSAKASDDGTNGHFEFSPIAMTRVLCPPPSMDVKISMDAQYIRSYLLKEGRLYLSLMADGGIFVWEPHEEDVFLTDPKPNLEEAILNASPDYTRELVNITKDGSGKARYVYGRVDLNNDGQDEVFAYLLGSIFCGTGGCNLLLFTQESIGYSLINNFPISRLPVIVSAEQTQGWHDFWRAESGGGAKASFVRYAFDGKQYIERERVSADKKPSGHKYLSGELYFDKGIPLEPKK